ncbi:trpE operon leader peptide TrpLE [Sinorhizobium numidicum]
MTIAQNISVWWWAR